MTTVLFAAELGFGFGHVSRLVAVAERLAERGVCPVFAVGDVCETFPLLGRRGWPVMQAPVSRALPHLAITDHKYKVSSFSDILYFVGYGSVDLLTPLVRAWEQLLDLVRPDLIVCDFAPTVILAASGAVPTVAIGDGFSQPPSGIDEFPPLRPEVPRQVDEGRVLAVVQAVQRSRGRAEPDALPKIFAADREFVCILPEFDPYRPQVPDRTIGPLRGLPEMLPDADPAEQVFVYLSGQYDKIDMVVEGLAAAKVRGTAYLRNARSSTVTKFGQAGIEVLTDVLPTAAFREAVGRSRCVVHHGGVGTSQDILAMGRPQIALPMTFEQQLTSDTLFRFRVGGRLRQGVTADAMTVGVRTAMESDDLLARARAAAEAVARRGSPASLPRVVEACETLAQA
ncbi:MAG: hypothetical protein AB7O45_13530 [Alphaproteobacteria bacterium]